MINFETLQKLDAEDRTDVLSTILEAQLNELIERRGVQDADTFKACFGLATPEDARFPEIIRDFQDIAAEAFDNYHNYRKKGGYYDKEKGFIVYVVYDNTDADETKTNTDETEVEAEAETDNE